MHITLFNIMGNDGTVINRLLNSNIELTAHVKLYYEKYNLPAFLSRLVFLMFLIIDGPAVCTAILARCATMSAVLILIAGFFTRLSRLISTSDILSFVSYLHSTN